MQCTAIQQRLVAFQDSELSPGELVRVQEHLASCSTCRSDQRSLDRIGPLRLEIPIHATRAMHEVTHPDLIWELAASRPKSTSVEPWSRWLTREIEVPTWWVLAAAALLATSIGWAASSSVSLDRSAVARAARAPSPPSAVMAPGAEVPANQFRAASWRASDDPVYH